MKRKLNVNRNSAVSYSIVIALYIALSIMSASGLLGRKYSSLLVPVCCYIVAAIGLNMNVGISGELNLGQAGFMSLGAFTAVIVAGALNFHGITAPALVLLICIICGTLVAGFLGWLMSIPVLKLEGDYLAIVTLAFGQIIVNIINNVYLGIDENGLHFSFVNNTLQMQPDGSVGINAVAEKTLAFVVSAALGGAAGALYGMNYSSFAATKFDFNLSILILVYVVLGGLGNMTGTIIATTLLVVLPEMLRFLSIYRMLIYAVVLIVIMIVTNNQAIRMKLKALRKGKAGNGSGKGASVNG